MTSLGYVDETLDAWVDGIVSSIERAHDSLIPGRVLLAEGELEDSNINRSPTRLVHSYIYHKEENLSSFIYKLVCFCYLATS